MKMYTILPKGYERASLKPARYFNLGIERSHFTTYKNLRMKTILLLLVILWSSVCCSPPKFKHYAGYIYQAGRPVGEAEIFEQDNPENRTQTNQDGFFTLLKRANGVSQFLMVRKNDTVVDSMQVIRTAGGEQLRYYFTERTKDTLFLNPD